MMSSGSSFSIKLIPHLATKLSYKQTNSDAKISSCKRVDDANQMMMINNRDKKKTTWRKPAGSESSAASLIFNMFGTSNKVIKRVLVKAENGIWGARSIKALKWFKGINDHRVDSAGNVEKMSSKISGVFWKVAVARKSRLVGRISVRKMEKRERKGFELCKRRILMGVKCKPVNASGKLHYGRDGVILAEDQA